MHGQSCYIFFQQWQQQPPIGNINSSENSSIGLTSEVIAQHSTALSAEPLTKNTYTSSDNEILI